MLTGDHRPDLVLLADPGELDARLEGDDHPDEEPDEQHDVETLDRPCEQVVGDRPDAPRDVVQAPDRAEEELDRMADCLAERDHGLQPGHRASATGFLALERPPRTGDGGREPL
jgi:hypothetical protein